MFNPDPSSKPNDDRSSPRGNWLKQHPRPNNPFSEQTDAPTGIIRMHSNCIQTVLIHPIKSLIRGCWMAFTATKCAIIRRFDRFGPTTTAPTGEERVHPSWCLSCRMQLNAIPTAGIGHHIESVCCYRLLPTNDQQLLVTAANWIGLHYWCVVLGGGVEWVRLQFSLFSQLVLHDGRWRRCRSCSYTLDQG